MSDVPPSPWALRGTARASVWRMPQAQLPTLPAGATPRLVRGTALVVTAFVAYDARGLMAYDELLAGVLVRHAGRTGLSITHIWVDSETSMTGGRAHWGIPKELAHFSHRSGSRSGADGDHASATGADGPLAGATFRRRRLPALPAPPLSSRVVQTTPSGEGTLASPIRASGRVAPAAGTWQFAPDGPLAWLRDARPMVSVAVTDFSMRFGL